MLSVINSNLGGVLKEMTKQDEQLYQYYQLYCFIIAAESLLLTSLRLPLPELNHKARSVAFHAIKTDVEKKWSCIITARNRNKEI